MSENSDFLDWENQLRAGREKIILPVHPNEDEDAIAFAQRIQIEIANAPLDDQESLTNDAMTRLRRLYGFEYFGRQLSVHAMRAYIFDPRQPATSGPIAELPNEFKATGIFAPFKRLPGEPTIGLGLDFPDISSDEKYPAAYFGMGKPLTIPVMSIEDHKLN